MLAAGTYAISDQQPRSEDLLKRAIDIDPSLARAYTMLGQLYVAQNRLEEGRRQFEGLAQRGTASVGAHTMIAVIFEAQGRPAEAETHYEKALAIDPSAVVAANNLAWMYANRGENLARALELAKNARARQPDAPDLSDTLGWVHFKRGDWKTALPLFIESVEKDPRNAVYLYHLGLAHLQAGAYDQAREALRGALTLSPDFVDAADARRVLASISSP